MVDTNTNQNFVPDGRHFLIGSSATKLYNGFQINLNNYGSICNDQNSSQKYYDSIFQIQIML